MDKVLATEVIHFVKVTQVDKFYPLDKVVRVSSNRSYPLCRSYTVDKDFIHRIRVIHISSNRPQADAENERSIYGIICIMHLNDMIMMNEMDMASYPIDKSTL